MPVNKKYFLIRIVAWLHLWLGLISGLVIFIVSITGAIFVFQKEISEVTRKQTLFIHRHDTSHALPLQALLHRAQCAIGMQKHISYVTVYTDSSRAWEFMAFAPGDPKGIFFPKTIQYYESVFVNPFTGEVTGKINYLHDFFVIVKNIHWSLFLNTRYGQPIVGWCTIIFIVILITGIILWFPPKWKRSEIKRAFMISWKSRWKRLNYDLHNVLGFYVFLVALLLALTGSLFAFNWMRNLFAYQGKHQSKPKNSLHFHIRAEDGFIPDQVLYTVRHKFPHATRFLLQLPADNCSPITIIVYHQKEVYYDASVFAFNQQTGELLFHESFPYKTVGEKILQMNYDIHVGAIGGIMGKCVAFLGSMICASLPITGLFIWIGKRKKKIKSLTSK